MLKIKMLLDTSAALALGKSTIGEQVIEVGDEFVQSLTAPQREELSSICTGSERMPGNGWCEGCHQSDIPIGAATPETLRDVLFHRAERRAAILREEKTKDKARETEREVERQRRLTCPVENLLRHWRCESKHGTWTKWEPYDCPEERQEEAGIEAERLTSKSYAPVRAASQAAEEKKAEEDVAKAEFSKKLTGWLAQQGTALQIGRRTEGFMFDDEILVLLRGSLFEALEDVPRFKQLTREDVECEATGEIPDEEDFEVDVEDEEIKLTDPEFSVLTALRKRVPTCEVKVRAHRAWCSCDSTECTVEGSTVYHTSVLVTTTWSGRKLSREYLLTGMLAPESSEAVGDGAVLAQVATLETQLATAENMLRRIAGALSEPGALYPESPLGKEITAFDTKK